MRTIVIIQARITSSRLPGKVLMNLGEMPVIAWCVRVALAIKGIDAVVVATSDDPSDAAIEQWCAKNSVMCVRGPLNNVLARYAMAARQAKADIVMRLTCDCPLLDPAVCAEVVKLLKTNDANYASNITDPRSWPQGLDCEVFTAETLYRAESEAHSDYDREHVTPYIRTHPHYFKTHSLACPTPGIGRQRWTLDTPKDLAFLSEVTQHLKADSIPSYTDVLAVLHRFPNLQNTNPV